MSADQLQTYQNLSVRICANPPVDRVIWELPQGHLIQPGQKQNSLALQSWPSWGNATCTDVKLFAQVHYSPAAGPNRDFGGKHGVLTKNRLGWAETHINVLIEPVNSFHQSSRCDRVHHWHQSFVFVLLV